MRTSVLTENQMIAAAVPIIVHVDVMTITCMISQLMIEYIRKLIMTFNIEGE